MSPEKAGTAQQDGEANLVETYLAELKKREAECAVNKRIQATRSELAHKIQHYEKEVLPVQCDRQIVADTKFKYYLKLAGFKATKLAAWTIILSLSLVQSISVMHWISPTSSFQTEYDDWGSWTPDEVKVGGW